MILTVAFFVVLVCGYFFVIGRIWQGRSEYDPRGRRRSGLQPPAVARRGAAFPVQGAASWS